MGEQHPSRRSSDLTQAQVHELHGKIDALQSTMNRVLARLDLLILPRIASVNAKADMILAGPTVEETSGAR